MKNNCVNIFIMLLLLALSGCAYTVVEVRSVPSLKEWDGNVDEKNHHPREVTDVLDVGQVLLSVNLSNYRSIDRGLTILGVESAKDPADNNSAKDSELGLILGIKSKSIKSSYFFEAEKIHLIVNENGQMIRLSPKAIFQQKKSVVCEWDYSFIDKTWGKKSNKIEHEVIEINPSNAKDDFECFNIIFDVAALRSRNYWAIDFSDTQLPLGGHNKVYFQPKKIKWVRSN